MSNFYLYNISFLDSILKGLHSNGASIEKVVNKGSIRKFDLNNPNTYLPLNLTYELFDRVKRSQGIDNLSEEFYSTFEVSELADYGEFLSKCPNLNSILMNAIQYDSMIQNSGKLYLRSQGALSIFSMVHMDRASAGRLASERINLAMIIRTFQQILGPGWSPVGVRTTESDPYWLRKLLPEYHGKVYTDSSEIAVIFKTSDLSKSNRLRGNPEQFDFMDLSHPKRCFEEILKSMNSGYVPTLEEIANYFGYSKRTAIRALGNKGVSFRKILDNHLFLESVRLLENPSMDIEDISMTLGYSHASNFIRAFKRWTAVTPDKYRAQQVTLNA